MVESSAKKLNVAFLVAKNDLDTATGAGIHRYMYELYNHMIKNRFGINVSKIESPIFPMIGSGLSFLISNMFRDFSNYDIIHNLDFKPLSPIKKNGAVWISTVHDLQPILYPEWNYDFENSIKNKLWSELVIKNGIRLSLNSDFIIARSTQTRAEILKFGYDKKNIAIINDGVDERFFRSKTASRISNKFKVGFIGALRAKKNIIFGINAFKHIYEDGIELDIWGRKEFMYDKWEEIAKQDRRIKFMGFAPESKLVDIYDSFDVFVFPTLHEGFGIPIIEAQARGLPVIIYKKGKIPEEVRRYCFEAEDEEDMARIVETLKENGYNEKLKKKATAYARSFTWKREAEETMEVYKRLVGNSKGG